MLSEVIFAITRAVFFAYNGLRNIATMFSERRKSMDLYKDVMNSYGLSPLPAKTVEAMAYVPFQPNGAEVYAVSEGFEAGTMFPTLNKPFYGGKCRGGLK